MAEIGLVASIFGVASFGTKVATSLYEAADVMYHAHDQISSMAKHVSQFTAVLRHLGGVLKAEKGNCSKDLLREIRKIKRSCRATFKEINRTVRSKRFRSFVPVRWLFKKGKAKELELRLDSEQNMLQVMIHTITVSKLGDMQSKSKEDSEQISGLREEIALLKTLIIENHDNATKLQRAEQRAEAEDRQRTSRGGYMHQGSQPIPGYPEPVSPRGMDLPYSEPPEPPVSPSSASSLSESDHEDQNPHNTSPDATRMSQDKAHQTSAKPPNYINNADRKLGDSVVQLASAYYSDIEFDKPRTSTLLLQMIPYEPSTSVPPYRDRSNYLISAGSNQTPGLEIGPKPAINEANRSVRLLLDKWTTSGSAPVSHILDAEATKDSQERRHEHRRRPLRYRPSLSDMSDDEFDYLKDDCDYQSRNRPRAYMPPSPPPPPRYGPMAPPPPAAHWTPNFGDVHSQDVWVPSHTYHQPPARYIGDHMLSALRYANGGILYIKSNDFQHFYYVDKTRYYQFNLVPASLVPVGESEPRSTHIGSSWVRQEALDLLGYPYQKTPWGSFTILRDIQYTEIEELVRLSFQAVGRQLEERSRELIEEKGWRETVAPFILNKGPEEPYNSPAPSAPWKQSKHPYPRYPPPGFDSQPTPNYPVKEERTPIICVAGRRPQEPNPQRQLDETQRAEENKPTASEVRFTLPHRDPGSRTATAPRSDKPESPTGKSELQGALEKLELLKKRREDALKANDNNIASDLAFYAIPDIEQRIQDLKRDQEKVAETATNDKPDPAPRTEIETDSDSGETSDENFAELDDGNMDLYE